MLEAFTAFHMIPLGEKHLRRILSEWLLITTKGALISASDRGFLNVPRYSHRCKITTNIPFPMTARLRLARFSAASITNTGGKGSPREGREELRGHCALIASPRFRMPVQAGRPLPFACGETNGLG
jgi:hypothetical protein